MSHVPRAALLTIALMIGTASAESPKTEILWDTWGVPHIFAPDEEGLFHAFGWAQMHNHGNALLRGYGTTRGRAAEYWGEQHFFMDKFIRSFDVPDQAQQWYEAQEPAFKANLDAFARGINAYAEAHPDLLTDSLEVVLPVSGEDVLTGWRQGLHIGWVGRGLDRRIGSFMVSEAGGWQGSILKLMKSGSEVLGNLQKWVGSGSNAWAIGPSRSASGNALLVSNPHVQWGGFFEAHLKSPGIDMYGFSPVGVPVLFNAFNDRLGWSSTNNTFDGHDEYELKLRLGGYVWNRHVRAFDIYPDTISVKQPDGELRRVPAPVYRSVHGPVIAMGKSKALATRFTGLDRPHSLRQLWEMAKARNFEQFESALKQLQMPMFNVLYADADGHIFYLYNGIVAKRPFGRYYDWWGIMPGDTDSTLWTETHPYDDLPKVLDPPTGWLQNANDPPWTCTIPQVLHAEDYPPRMAPNRFDRRPARSVRMLMEDDSITFDELIAYKHSTRMETADRFLDELIASARESGSDLAREAADVLEKWDRQAEVDSRGAELFRVWDEKLPWPRYKTSWDRTRPLETPKGLLDPAAAVKALEAAATQVKEMYGELDVAWGDVWRLRLGEIDLPANGATGDLGVFRVMRGPLDTDGKRRANFGDSFVGIIEFSDPPRARTLLSWGNATQPHSKHFGDQLELFSRKELKPAWRTRDEIEANLEKREVF